jgi:hypothetical protein
VNINGRAHTAPQYEPQAGQIRIARNKHACLIVKWAMTMDRRREGRGASLPSTTSAPASSPFGLVRSFRTEKGRRALSVVVPRGDYEQII